MKLKLYKNKDSENTMNKNLVFVSEYDVNLRRDFDSTYPNIKLKVSEIGTKDFNYLEIVELGKKYLVKKASYLANGVLEIECEIDVLETYKTEILNSNFKYKRKIKEGDYVNSSIEKLTDPVFDNYYSEQGISENDSESMVLTTLGVEYGL